MTDILKSKDERRTQWYFEILIQVGVNIDRSILIIYLVKSPCFISIKLLNSDIYINKMIQLNLFIKKYLRLLELMPFQLHLNDY